MFQETMFHDFLQMPESFFLGVALFFGLAVGSFFNVLIYRMPRNESIFHPPSHCPNCGDSIPWYLNVPVLAWLYLKGKCRSCRQPISMEYPLVELLTGILSFGTIFWMLDFDSSPSFARGIVLLWLALASVPVFFVDFRHQLIPDSVSFGGLVLGIAVSFLPGAIGWQQSLIGIAVAGPGLFAFGWMMSKILHKDAMGFGDVKLLASFGALLGLNLTLMSLVFAAILGLFITIPLKWILKEGREVPLPFGPYLILGALLSHLWGKEIWQWYLNIFLA